MNRQTPLTVGDTAEWATLGSTVEAALLDSNTPVAFGMRIGRLSSGAAHLEGGR